MTRLSLATIIGLLVATTPADAHHSAAPFDFTKLMEVEGVVKSFEVINPHTHALVILSDGSRGTRVVDFEGHSASNFYRAGYKRGSVNAGDRIKLLIAPRRDRRDGGFIMQFKNAQGQVVGFGNLMPDSGRAKP